MTHRNRVARRATISAAALSLATTVAVSACYTGDQSCSPPFNVDDLGDHCPYGSPGGPKLTDGEKPCPEIKPKMKGTDECKVNGQDISFEQHVYPRLEAADGGSCTKQGMGCHAKFPYKGVATWQSAPQMIDSLSQYKGEIGAIDKERTYINPTKSTKSWFVCNLRGQAGVLMPSGIPRMTIEDVALVEQWLACGAPTGGGS